jgi:dynein heavy chain 2
VYLEPIFGAGTLSQDQTRFRRVDKDFRYVMGDVAQDSKVVSLCRIGGLHQILHTLLDQLSRCQKSLNDFLEVSIFANGKLTNQPTNQPTN